MRYIILILCVGFSFSVKAQSINDNELVRVSNYQSPVPAKFRLYPTTNRFTFLRNLDNSLSVVLSFDLLTNSLPNANCGLPKYEPSAPFNCSLAFCSKSALYKSSFIISFGVKDLSILIAGVVLIFFNLLTYSCHIFSDSIK